MADTVVIHAAYPLSRKHMLVTAARAKQLQANGDDVTLTYCAAKAGVCMVNHTANPALCAVCRSTVRGTARSVGVPAIPLKDAAPQAGVDTPGPTVGDRCRLLEGVYSDLISRFRLLRPDVRRSPLLNLMKRRYFKTAMRRLRGFAELIGRLKPDRVEVFNGRQACSKFPLIAAERVGIPITTLETRDGVRPVVFEGHTAHDRVKIQDRMLTCEANFDEAEAYYQRRRSPRFSRFTKQLQGGFTPPDTSAYRRKVTFFLSSQDEFESLGPDWKTEFDDDAGVVEAACRRHPDTFFAVRFHPNQGKINSDVTGPFAAIAGLPNVAVYAPNSGVNTYELIDWSDVIVTFGSTITAEACWAGRPTVLLGRSFFDRLGIAVTPATIDEFLDLLDGEIPLSDRTNAARVAAYYQDNCDPMPHLDTQSGAMKPVGFRKSLPILTRLCRIADKAACQIVKAVGKQTATKFSSVDDDPSAIGESRITRNAA